MIWKLSSSSRHFLDHLETFQFIRTLCILFGCFYSIRTFSKITGNSLANNEHVAKTFRIRKNFPLSIADTLTGFLWLCPQLGSWRELVGLGSQKGLRRRVISWFWSFLLFPNCSSIVSAKPWTWLIILETNANLAWPPLHFWEVIKCQMRLSFHWLWLCTKICQFMSKAIFHQGAINVFLLFE